MRLTNFSMETGTGSTDSSGQAQLSLKGQYFYAPVVTVISQADTSGAAVDAFGNTNVYIKSVSKGTGQWLVTIQSEPFITFQYQAMGQILERV